MFASSGDVGREITNRGCCGPVLKFFASGTFFSSKLDAASVVAIITHEHLYTVDVPTCGTTPPPARHRK